ncbi:MAG: hypothetical protein AAF533_02185 [Acidobacteriota bacterium]
MTEGEQAAARCRHCEEPIHAEATRCPHCRNAQDARHRWLWLVPLSILLGVGFMGGFFGTIVFREGERLLYPRSSEPPENVNPPGVALLEQNVGAVDNPDFGPAFIGFGRWRNDSESEAWGAVRATCEVEGQEPAVVSRAWLGVLPEGGEDVFRVELEGRDWECDSMKLELMGKVRR